MIGALPAAGPEKIFVSEGLVSTQVIPLYQFGNRLTMKQLPVSDQLREGRVLTKKQLGQITAVTAEEDLGQEKNLFYGAKSNEVRKNKGFSCYKAYPFIGEVEQYNR